MNIMEGKDEYRQRSKDKLENWSIKEVCHGVKMMTGYSKLEDPSKVGNQEKTNILKLKGCTLGICRSS